jgi:hypothetical protein
VRRYIVVLIAAAASLAFGMPAAQAGVGGEQPPVGLVTTTPPSDLPHLLASTSQVQQVRQIVQCGTTMYAVGTFSSINQAGKTYTRNNIFSFSAMTPFTLTSWAPNVVGPYGNTKTGFDVVSTIAFVNGDCSHAYIGGKFTSVNGTAVNNIAEITTSGTGSVVTGFKSNASGTVQTIAAVGGHLLVGGDFTSINGDTTDPYMVSLNPTTGQSDGFLQLHISGNYQYPNVSPNPTRVYNQQLSPDGTLDLVEGDFTSVGGQARQQAFILSVSGTAATVTGWNAPEFNTHCYVKEPFYVRDGAWSPDGSAVYFGTTGFHPNNQTTPPWTGPCDAALAFPATQTTVSARWTNYTGCDSLYSASADSKAAYFAGHERWSMNPNGCDFEGPGAYPAPGTEGVDPANGALYLNPAGTAGLYSRDRGFGADDMLLTSAGLWIASDNYDQSQFCGGVSTSGICFLPYS